MNCVLISYIFFLHYLNLFTKTSIRVTIHITTFHFIYFIEYNEQKNRLQFLMIESETIYSSRFFLLPLSAVTHSAAHENRYGLVVLSYIHYPIFSVYPRPPSTSFFFSPHFYPRPPRTPFSPLIFTIPRLPVLSFNHFKHVANDFALSFVSLSIFFATSFFFK